MAGFNSLRQLYDSIVLAGKVRRFAWHKNVTVSTPGGVWFDLTLSTGNPPPIYYASTPLISLGLYKSLNGGLNFGASVAPSTKYISKFLIQTSTAAPLPAYFTLVDSLLCYPFVDQSTNDEQVMTNSVSIPRYTDGRGCQVIAVSVAPPSGAGNATFSFTYTNSDGVSGRVSRTVRMNTFIINGITLFSSQGSVNMSANPFIPLQDGDTGVRSIESCRMVSGTDTGLMTLVIVRPIMDTCLYGADAPTETIPYFYKNEMIEVKDDACLNLLCCASGSLNTARLLGTIEFIWT